MLCLTVDERGRVVDVGVVEGLGHGLDEVSVNAALSMEFVPGTVDGRPTATKFLFTFRFVLQD